MQKKKSQTGGSLHIVLGTSRGGLALFSFATAKVKEYFSFCSVSSV